jgi:hypothetical protein
VAKRKLAGLGSEPMKPSHSSVTTKVTRMCWGLFKARKLAEVHHHVVDVASTGIGHGHHVADSWWICFGGIHLLM